MPLGIGVNMEFIRHEDRPFAAGLERAAQLGFRYVEPMVHNGRELLSEAGYFHSVSLDDEPLEIRDLLARYGLRPSGLSAHCPLMRPEISVPYLQKAIRFAAAIGAPVVNTDEGVRPGWLGDEEIWPVMRYTLTATLRTAELYGVCDRDRAASEHLAHDGRPVADRRAGGVTVAAFQLRYRQRVPWRRGSL